MAVIEGGDQLQGLRQQHPVAEHVARHVAAARDGDRVLLDVHPHFAEVALDAHPCAARGDAHRLVVIAVRAAAGESVVEPEVARLGDAVRDVGEGRGALVGGDHEIGVLPVKRGDALRVHHPPGDDVVGDRQQRADEDFIGGAALGGPTLAVDRGAGELLGIEPALRARRHDHRVLDALGLHQPENLGAEVIAPVGPAQPPARHRARAQVDALDPPRIDENLAPWQRLGEARNLGGFELEGQCLGGSGGEGVGAQHRIDHRAVEPQQAVVVDRGDLGETTGESALRGGDGFLAVPIEGRIVARLEQVDHGAGHLRRGGERVDHGVDRVGQPRLAQVAIDRAQPVRLAREQPCGGHQTVEGIILRRAVQHVRQCRLDQAGAFEQRACVAPGGQGQQEFVDRAEPRIGEVGRHFGQHPEAEILEGRDHVRQGQRAAGVVDLQPQRVRPVTRKPVEPHRTLAWASDRGIGFGHGQPAQLGDVARGFLGAIGEAVAGREGRGIARGERGGAAIILVRGEVGGDRLVPAAQQIGQLRLDRGVIGQAGTGAHVDQETQQREGRALDLEAPVEQLGTRRGEQHRLDLQSHVGAHVIARQPDEGEDVPFQRCADHDDARARAVDQRHLGGDEVGNALGIEGGEEVVGERGEGVHQRLAIVPGRVEAETRGDVRHHCAQHRHFARPLVHRRAGPKPGMDRERGDFALLAHRHDEQIERAGAVDA